MKTFSKTSFPVHPEVSCTAVTTVLIPNALCNTWCTGEMPYVTHIVLLSALNPIFIPKLYIKYIRNMETGLGSFRQITQQAWDGVNHLHFWQVPHGADTTGPCWQFENQDNRIIPGSADASREVFWSWCSQLCTKQAWTLERATQRCGAGGPSPLTTRHTTTLSNWWPGQGCRCSPCWMINEWMSLWSLRLCHILSSQCYLQNHF